MAHRNSVWCSMMVISYRRTNVFFTVCILTTMIHLCFYSHTESATVKRNVGRGPSRQLPCSRAWAEHKWHSVAPFCPWLCYTLARPQSLGTSSAKGEPEALPKTRFLPLLPQSMEPQATLKRKGMKTQWAGSVQFGSVAQSCPTLLQPHEPQHTRPPCPSPTPRVYPNPCPLSRWWHPTIASSVVPFSSCPQYFPAAGSFPMSQLFASGGQSTGVSALASFLPKKSQGWSPSEWTGWISLQSKGLSQESSPTPHFKSINSLALSFLYSPTLTCIHDHRKNHSLD